MSSLEAPPTAAALVIGNEILSGKVEEANVAPLARLFRELGVSLRRVVTVLDDVDGIAREVAALSASHDWLVTSGGVGPTHDDVTVEGVAKAFGVPVVSDPDLEARIRAHWGSRCTEGHLRMALVPQGAVLEGEGDVRIPTVRLGNTWLLPGVPEIFRAKLPVVGSRIGAGRAFVSRAVYVQLDEGELKELLDRVVAAFADVEIGSYPKWLDPTYKTKLTFDSRDPARAAAAQAAFCAGLPAGEPQRVD